MKKTIVEKIINLTILLIIIYFILFISYHLITPDIGYLDLKITSSTSSPGSQIVTMTTSKVLNHYYLLVYAHSSDEHWLYSAPPHHPSNGRFIKDMFLLDDKKKYILVEGNQYKNHFTFTLTPKYPVRYMSTKEHIFHVHYIVPYQVFPFPPFYYSKHYTFFLE